LKDPKIQSYGPPGSNEVLVALEEKETSEAALDQGKNAIIKALETENPQNTGKQDLNNTGPSSLAQYLLSKDPLRLGTDAPQRYLQIGQQIDDTLAALSAFDGTVVLHCFSSPHLLPTALERGWYVSFAGNATFPNASELRVAATQVPADRILAETDSPYLAPQPVRGRRNEPAYVMYTLVALAQARGEDAAELERRIDANATACFGL
jgi:hypothetical protein